MKKFTATQTHFGFTNLGLKVHRFSSTATYFRQFSIGTPCRRDRKKLFLSKLWFGLWPSFLTCISPTLSKGVVFEKLSIFRYDKMWSIFTFLFSVIGVALLVGVLFFLMIAVEQAFEWLGNQCSKTFGSKSSKDPEDPAALVGSFKRYKN